MIRGDADAGRVERVRRKARRRYAHDPLLGPIERRLLEAFAVADAEAGEEPSRHRRLPERGMQSARKIYYVKLEEPRTDATGARLPRRTPAMRLGLAKGPIRIEDILYFTP